MNSSKENAFLVSKWSSIPSEQRAQRVRNNQRRHREKVKRRVEDLEARLAETEKQLQQALLTIHDLNSKLESFQQPNKRLKAPHQSPRVSARLQGHMLASAVDKGGDAPSHDESQYTNLQPPQSHESTTRCRDAFGIIAAHNYAGLESHKLDAWLRPGFRGAIAKGDGCRVDNKLLYSLLDRISS